ncbi:MAG: PA0069 family radical SAM protein [Acidobacteriota bacterium]|nr:MAG: PA0069 family radical SAM protein [Acidobacteriota bacterium]
MKTNLTFPLTAGRIKGRGTPFNIPGRFETLELVPESESLPERSAIKTEFLADCSKSIIARNDSPDVGFDRSINPYRGCEHGCAYCFARPTHEYLGLSSGLDFESKILVKEKAAELLREELFDRKWRPQPIALSGITDPYQPVERKLEVTRGCLEVLAEFCNPVAVVTKNFLVTRDIDLLSELARSGAAHVSLSITTLKPELQRTLEPRTSTPQRRLEAVKLLSAMGIPVRVFIAPIIPGINDSEIPAIVRAAKAAGARCCQFMFLRLPHGVESLFKAWLDQHFPLRKEKVLGHLRELRGGQLNDYRFFSRMRGDGTYAEQIKQLFVRSCQKEGLDDELPPLTAAFFRRPARTGQLRLFS